MKLFAVLHFNIFYLTFHLGSAFATRGIKDTFSMTEIKNFGNKILTNVCGGKQNGRANEKKLAACLQSLETSPSKDNGIFGSRNASNAALSLINRRSRKVRSISYNYCKGTSTDKRCCVRSYYVNFKDDLGWNWIHAPSGLHLNTCSGGCHQDWGDTSSRAQLMSRLMKLKSLPHLAPKCVPHHYEPVTILYYDNGHPTLREMDEVILTECKCM